MYTCSLQCRRAVTNARLPSLIRQGRYRVRTNCQTTWVTYENSCHVGNTGVYATDNIRIRSTIGGFIQSTSTNDRLLISMKLHSIYASYYGSRAFPPYTPLWSHSIFPGASLIQGIVVRGNSCLAMHHKSKMPCSDFHNMIAQQYQSIKVMWAPRGVTKSALLKLENNPVQCRYVTLFRVESWGWCITKYELLHRLRL